MQDEVSAVVLLNDGPYSMAPDASAMTDLALQFDVGSSPGRVCFVTHPDRIPFIGTTGGAASPYQTGARFEPRCVEDAGAGEVVDLNVQLSSGAFSHGNFEAEFQALDSDGGVVDSMQLHLSVPSCLELCERPCVLVQNAFMCPAP